jgi:transposase
MIRIRLTAKQEAEVSRRLAATKSIDEHNRCQAVLMAHRGRRRDQIAQDLGRSPRTIQRYLNRFREDQSTQAKKSPGSKPKIADELAETIKGWIRGGPMSLGLYRANWTFQEVTDQIKLRLGIKASERTFRRFSKKHGIGVYRPTYEFRKADPAKRAEKVREFADLEKKRSPAS